MIPATRAACEALDAADPLAFTRARFDLPPGVTYLDGEHLGRLRTIPLFLETLCLVDRTEEGGPVSWAEAARRPLCLLTPDMQNRRIVAARLAEADAPAGLEQLGSAVAPEPVSVAAGPATSFYVVFAIIAALGALMLVRYYRRMSAERLEIVKLLTDSTMPLGLLTVIVLAVILFGITTATESAAVGAAE